jgi:hypothetical protein
MNFERGLFKLLIGKDRRKTLQNFNEIVHVIFRQFVNKYDLFIFKSNIFLRIVKLHNFC